MNISKVTFPLYKLRSYLTMEKSILGLIEITTIKGKYVLDDLSINATFPERRLLLGYTNPGKQIYKLKEQINYLRQLLKYKTGTTFIDHNGHIFKYEKSTKLFKVQSYKLGKVKPWYNWSIIKAEGLELSFIIGVSIPPEIKYISIMLTDWGPMLYDLTTESHEVYRRKI